MGVTLLPSSPDWPAAFEREAGALREHLAPWLAGGVHHVGSTAIPGLAAKPILDMMAGVRDLALGREAVTALAGLGYRHADHRPHEALWFFKPGGADLERRTHQLHLTEVGSRLWKERLAFRDALRADVGLRAEYAALKHRLATNADTLADYTRGKRAFVARVLRGAGIELD